MKTPLHLFKTCNRLLLLALTLLLVFSCKEESDVFTQQAQDDLIVSQEQAITVAENLSFGSPGKKRDIHAQGATRQEAVTKKVKAIKAVKDRKNKDAFFIINYKDGGFAIISADERVLPILAYSETGFFATDTIPSGLNEWLVSTVIGIEGAREEVTTPNPSVQNEWNRLEAISKIKSTISAINCNPTVRAFKATFHGDLKAELANLRYF